MMVTHFLTPLPCPLQLPYAEFMALQCRADVALDPFPFGGGVTMLEAVACRTPFITLGIFLASIIQIWGSSSHGTL